MCSTRLIFIGGSLAEFVRSGRYAIEPRRANRRLHFLHSSPRRVSPFGSLANSGLHSTDIDYVRNVGVGAVPALQLAGAGRRPVCAKPTWSATARRTPERIALPWPDSPARLIGS